MNPTELRELAATLNALADDLEGSEAAQVIMNTARSSAISARDSLRDAIAEAE